MDSAPLADGTDPSSPWTRSSAGNGLLAISVLALIALLPTVFIRAAHSLKRRSWSSTDMVVFLASGLAVALDGVYIASAAAGTGSSLDDLVGAPDEYSALRLPYIASAISSFALLFSIAGVALTTASHGLGRGVKLALLGVVLLCVVGNVWAGIAGTLGCDTSIESGDDEVSCVLGGATTAGLYFAAGVNLLFGVVVVGGIEGGLRTKGREIQDKDRRVLRGVQGLVALATVMAAGRLGFLVQVVGGDLAVGVVGFGCFSLLEITITIIASTAPALSELLPSFWHRFRDGPPPRPRTDSHASESFLPVIDNEKGFVNSLPRNPDELRPWRGLHTDGSCNGATLVQLETHETTDRHGFLSGMLHKPRHDRRSSSSGRHWPAATSSHPIGGEDEISPKTKRESTARKFRSSLSSLKAKKSLENAEKSGDLASERPFLGVAAREGTSSPLSPSLCCQGPTEEMQGYFEEHRRLSDSAKREADRNEARDILSMSAAGRTSGGAGGGYSIWPTWKMVRASKTMSGSTAVGSSRDRSSSDVSSLSGKAWSSPLRKVGTYQGQGQGVAGVLSPVSPPSAGAVLSTGVASRDAGIAAGSSFETGNMPFGRIHPAFVSAGDFEGDVQLTEGGRQGSETTNGTSRLNFSRRMDSTTAGGKKNGGTGKSDKGGLQVPWNWRASWRASRLIAGPHLGSPMASPGVYSGPTSDYGTGAFSPGHDMFGPSGTLNSREEEHGQVQVYTGPASYDTDRHVIPGTLAAVPKADAEVPREGRISPTDEDDLYRRSVIISGPVTASTASVRQNGTPLTSQRTAEESGKAPISQRILRKALPSPPPPPPKDYPQPESRAPQQQEEVAPEVQPRPSIDTLDTINSYSHGMAEAIVGLSFDPSMPMPPAYSEPKASTGPFKGIAAPNEPIERGRAPVQAQNPPIRAGQVSSPDFVIDIGPGMDHLSAPFASTFSPHPQVSNHTIRSANNLSVEVSEDSGDDGASDLTLLALGPLISQRGSTMSSRTASTVILAPPQPARQTPSPQPPSTSAPVPSDVSGREAEDSERRQSPPSLATRLRSRSRSADSKGRSHIFYQQRLDEAPRPKSHSRSRSRSHSRSRVPAPTTTTDSAATRSPADLLPALTFTAPGSLFGTEVYYHKAASSVDLSIPTTSAGEKAEEKKAKRASTGSSAALASRENSTGSRGAVETVTPANVRRVTVKTAQRVASVSEEGKEELGSGVSPNSGVLKLLDEY